LKSWILQIDLKEGERTDNLDEQKIDCLYSNLALIEYNLSYNCRKLNDWDNALHYIEKSVLHAILMKEGEIKIERLLVNLNSLGEAFHKMGKLTESKAIREEAYMHVSEIHNHEHPLVLEIGGNLIEILIATGELYDAERFARVCYDSLTRVPLDPDSYEAANAARNLTEVSCDLIRANGLDSVNIEEAEMLARKAVYSKALVVMS
jgi:tetratricopeptide (TPR) repeat protein